MSESDGGIGCRTPIERTYGCNHMTVSPHHLASRISQLIFLIFASSAQRPAVTRKSIPLLLIKAQPQSHTDQLPNPSHFCYVCGDSIVRSVVKATVDRELERHYSTVCDLFEAPPEAPRGLPLPMPLPPPPLGRRRTFLRRY